LNEILKTSFSEISKTSSGANFKGGMAWLRQNFKTAPERTIKFKNFIKENDGKKRDFTQN
jgi:hypothetical protein